MKPIAEDDRRLLVKQSYPYKTKGVQECEAVRRKYALKETSRIMTSEGTVIKMMEDGNIEVSHQEWSPPKYTRGFYLREQLFSRIVDSFESVQISVKCI